jgi:hypothetical protein
MKCGSQTVSIKPLGQKGRCQMKRWYVTTGGLLLCMGFGNGVIGVGSTARADFVFGIPTNLGPVVNSEADIMGVCASYDGLSLYFCSDRSDGYGSYDLWIATREKVGLGWSAPVNLGPTVNSTAGCMAPSISADGLSLYFVSNRPGGYGQRDIWQVPLIPIADFNADGQVDLVDLVMLIDTWGTDTVLCDIGPMPWGDGKVDIEDLKVFVTEWEKENPPAQP